jgi:tetratricopeptide (TPR) repeat protein
MNDSCHGSKALEGPNPNINPNSKPRNGDCESKKADWTDSYSFWSKWEDTDELKIKRKEEETKQRADMAPSTAFMGHDHDHSVERKLLELSERDKMTHCEKHRIKGNYLFLESLFPKAAEQYQLALSYYEYCFPEEEELQTELDTLRYACLCNISLCFYRMGLWRMSINSATQVIEEDANNIKALYRRAQAYRALDEYSHAEIDINKAYNICPSDKGIKREITALQVDSNASPNPCLKSFYSFIFLMIYFTYCCACNLYLT